MNPPLSLSLSLSLSVKFRRSKALSVSRSWSDKKRALSVSLSLCVCLYISQSGCRDWEKCSGIEQSLFTLPTPAGGVVTRVRIVCVYTRIYLLSFSPNLHKCPSCVKYLFFSFSFSFLISPCTSYWFFFFFFKLKC